MVNNSKISSGLPHSEIFGYNVYSQLPKAYRRVSRPSSPLTAKASTKRPFRAWFDPEKDRLNYPTPAMRSSSRSKHTIYFPFWAPCRVQNMLLQSVLRLERLVYLTWIVGCIFRTKPADLSREDQNPIQLTCSFSCSRLEAYRPSTLGRSA